MTTPCSASVCVNATDATPPTLRHNKQPQTTATDATTDGRRGRRREVRDGAAAWVSASLPVTHLPFATIDGLGRCSRCLLACCLLPPRWPRRAGAVVRCVCLVEWLGLPVLHPAAAKITVATADTRRMPATCDTSAAFSGGKMRWGQCICEYSKHGACASRVWLTRLHRSIGARNNVKA